MKRILRNLRKLVKEHQSSCTEENLDHKYGSKNKTSEIIRNISKRSEKLQDREKLIPNYLDRKCPEYLDR